MNSWYQGHSQEEGVVWPCQAVCCLRLPCFFLLVCHEFLEPIPGGGGGGGHPRQYSGAGDSQVGGKMSMLNKKN
jgi:hypothetical protein